MSDWTNEPMNEGINGWVNKWIGEWVREWLSERKRKNTRVTVSDEKTPLFIHQILSKSLVIQDDNCYFWLPRDEDRSETEKLWTPIERVCLLILEGYHLWLTKRILNEIFEKLHEIFSFICLLMRIRNTCLSKTNERWKK